jgi:hypothetical protein
MHYKNYKHRIYQKYSSISNGNCKRGVTLLEVLLYVGLFTILSISITFLYISISKSAGSIRSGIQRTEIAFFVYEIVRHRLDTFGYLSSSDSSATSNNRIYVKPEDFSRILKYYPNIKMTEIVVTPINVLEIASKNNYTSITYKISYKLVHKNINNLSEKIFSNTLYIDSL